MAIVPLTCAGTEVTVSIYRASADRTLYQPSLIENKKLIDWRTFYRPILSVLNGISHVGLLEAQRLEGLKVLELPRCLPGMTPAAVLSALPESLECLTIQDYGIAEKFVEEDVVPGILPNLKRVRLFAERAIPFEGSLSESDEEFRQWGRRVGVEAYATGYGHDQITAGVSDAAVASVHEANLVSRPNSARTIKTCAATL